MRKKEKPGESLVSALTISFCTHHWIVKRTLFSGEQVSQKNVYCFTFRLVWILYVIFTSLHLFANYSAVTSVVMETLNQARLHILLQEYFTTDTVLSTSEVNYKEPVVFSKLLLSFLQSFLIPHANKVLEVI